MNYPRVRQWLSIFIGLLVAAWLLAGDLIACWLLESVHACDDPDARFLRIYRALASGFAIVIWFSRQVNLSPGGWYRRWQSYFGLALVVPFASWPTSDVIAIVKALVSSSSRMPIIGVCLSVAIAAAKVGIVVTWYRLLMASPIWSRGPQVRR